MSDADRNLLQRAAGHAVDLFEWIRDSLASEAARESILLDLGLEPSATPPLDIPDERLDSIDRYRQHQDPDFEAFISTWGDIVAILEAIDAFLSADPDTAIDVVEDATYSLVTLLGTDFVRLRYQLYGWDVDESTPTPVADALSSRMLSFLIEGTRKDSAGGGSVAAKVGASMAWVPEEHGGGGLFVALHGSEETTAPVSDDWRLKVKFASAGAVDFLIGKSITVNGPSDASATATLETSRKAEKGPYVLGVAKGTRLEIGKVAITMQIGAAGASVKAVAKDSTLVLTVAEADPFVERAIPAGEVRFDFKLGLGVANDRGLFLEGGSGLQLSLPLNRTFGPVRLRQLTVSLGGGSTGKAVQTEFLATLDVKLGPVTATLDRLGFAAAADPKDRDPPSIGYRGPSGIGLVIDSEPVKGSGYLFRDAASGQYAGAVQLDVGGLTLQAVGLITTKMPDGSRGFSLLVIVSVADFTPINLPFGFRLTGVGGLVGLNRTADVEALRAGLKNRTLDAILFPENPVADAARIVSALQAVMPVREGQFMAGLTGQFEWGVPTVLTLELGFVLEAPDPWRLLILGQLRALLPHEDHVLVRLQMDALGVIDWDRDEISIDAVLYDSHILTYVLTGEMALRARWSGERTFLLAVGGFNPNFTPPAGFPALARTSLTVNRGDSTRLRLESYHALTSNTAQAGARVDLLVRASGFSVEGYLGYDALFQFSPFMFIVDIRGGVTLKWHGRTLLGVELELTLSGPSPWHARGRATFKIWRFSKSISFDRVCGADTPPPALAPVDPMPALVQALSDPRNWGTEPTARTGVLTLRDERGAGELLVHPLGELSVRQRVVPLGIRIDRFGNTVPAGDRRFTLEVTTDGRPPSAVEPVLDFFAPAQFLEMTDAAKLRRPSFEPMEAGIRIGGGLDFGGADETGLIGEAPIEYETVIPGAEAEEDVRERLRLDIGAEELRGRIAVDHFRDPARRAGRAKFAAPGLGVELPRARYVVASTRDLSPVGLADLDPGGAPSYTAAAQALWRHEEERPEDRGRLQVITVFATDGDSR
ncbi:MAG: hypothetical protein P8177_07805 [Gemmatimonadota bacterium]